MIRSSYIQNNYAEVFRSMIHAYKPEIGIELGALDGYSAIATGKAMKEIKRGTLDVYDLFDAYPFKHGSQQEIQTLLDMEGLDNVKLHQGDAYQVHELVPNNWVHWLHVDISNDGETFDRIMDLWDPKMVPGGYIVFEGGTQERDAVEWLIKYNKRPIKPAIENNKIVLAKYVFGSYLKFPGLTVLLKKRD